MCRMVVIICGVCSKGEPVDVQIKCQWRVMIEGAQSAEAAGQLGRVAGILMYNTGEELSMMCSSNENRGPAKRYQRGGCCEGCHKQHLGRMSNRRKAQKAQEEADAINGQDSLYRVRKSYRRFVRSQDQQEDVDMNMGEELGSGPRAGSKRMRDGSPAPGPPEVAAASSSMSSPSSTSGEDSAGAALADFRESISVATSSTAATSSFNTSEASRLANVRPLPPSSSAVLPQSQHPLLSVPTQPPSQAPPGPGTPTPWNPNVNMSAMNMTGVDPSFLRLSQTPRSVAILNNSSGQGFQQPTASAQSSRSAAAAGPPGSEANPLPLPQIPVFVAVSNPPTPPTRTPPNGPNPPAQETTQSLNEAALLQLSLSSQSPETNPAREDSDGDISMPGESDDSLIDAVSTNYEGEMGDLLSDFGSELTITEGEEPYVHRILGDVSYWVEHWDGMPTEYAEEDW